MLVNLSTTDKILEDLILTEYPGKIFEDQVSKTDNGERKPYCFSGLEYEELTKFLINYLGYKFEIIEPATGRIIEDDRNFINPYFYH